MTLAEAIRKVSHNEYDFGQPITIQERFAVVENSTIPSLSLLDNEQPVTEPAEFSIEAVEPAEAIQRVATEVRSALKPESIYKVELYLGQNEIEKLISALNNPDRMLDLGEASALLEIEPANLESMTESGQIPGVRLGDEWRFSKQRLAEMLTDKKGYEEHKS